MKHRLARSLLFVLLAFMVGGLLVRGSPPLAVDHPRPDTTSPKPSRLVFLGGQMSDEAIICLASAIAARGDGGILIFDNPKSTLYTKAFLTAYRPGRIIPVGHFPQGIIDLERRLEVNTEPVLAIDPECFEDLGRALLPQSDKVVLCPAEPRSLSLHAAVLAGVMEAPLVLVHDKATEKARHSNRLKEGIAKLVLAVGDTADLCQDIPNLRVERLADSRAVSAFTVFQQARKGPVRTLVVSNPADSKDCLGDMSAFAPLVALEHHAALLLTNPAGDNVEQIVDAALKNKNLRQAETVILVAGLKAVPMKQRPNPIEGKDPVIDLEPLTPKGQHPFSFAVGRLFHQEPPVIALMLARQRLLAEAHGPRKALVASNPGGSLKLLEVLSRNTVMELQNAGYETTALFGKDVNQEDLRNLLAENDLFLWEGHHNTLICDYKFPEWDEPLPPSLIFLQSCLALKEHKVLPLLQHGAVGVIGSSTRVYSGSGGATSLAFMDAMLYEGQSMGGALRQAKNFLLAYSLLKEKRLGDKAKRGGANLRSAWAFTLWGDPTLKLPNPETPAGAGPHVHHEVHGRTIVLKLPDSYHDRVSTSKYEAHMPMNGRLAGLVVKDKDDESMALVPMLFAEVGLPRAPAHCKPRLQSKLPSSRYVFCWDERRRTGYLLVLPRPTDQKELLFHVHWEAEPKTGTVANHDPVQVGTE